MVYFIILNLIGIISCIIENRMLTYLVSYIVAISFFNHYTKFAWKLIYEPFVSTSTIAESVGVKLMNILATIIVITSVFVFICFEFESLCLTVSIIQCIVFQVVDLYRSRTYKNTIILMVLLVEIFLAVGF